MLGSLSVISSCAKKKTGQKKANTTSKSVAGPSGGEGVEKAQNWSYFEIKRSSLIDAVQIEGKLEASVKIEMRAEKRMRIGPAKVKVADHVRKGDVLFVVDTKEFEQKKQAASERVAQLNVDIKSSKAQLLFASKQHDRKKGLAAKGIAAQKELEEAQKALVTAESHTKTKELELRKAERELSAANETVSTANVVSPIDGIVSSIMPGGDEVNQGQSLAMISNPAQLSMVVPVDETIVTRFKQGQTVQILVEAAPDKPIEGVVRGIEARPQQPGGSAVNSYNLSVGIAADIVKSLNLRDGYAAQVRAVFGEKKNALTVPRSGLKQNGRDSFLMIADARGKAPAARAVKVGVVNDLEAEILEGIKEGEMAAVATERGGQQP